MRTPLLILLAASPALAQPAHYETHLLPGLGGTLARPLAINNHGMMTGQATRPGQTYEVAVAWLDGHCIELGGSGFSLAGGQGVTDSGLVIGYTDQLGARAIQATPPGPVTMIPQLQSTFSHALAINANNDIVGSYTTSPRPISLRAGVVTPLPLLGGTQGVALAINNSGTIVGWSSLSAAGGLGGVRWINDQPTQLVGGASQTIAYGVNDEGWIVGYSSGAPLTTYEASLWTDPTTRTNLGALAGNWNNIAYAINNHRQIVGASGSIGFLWQDGQIYNLNSLTTLAPGQTITDARAISDTGLIAAQVTQGGQSYAAILVPTCSADFNHDGDLGTDADIEAFFACLAGNCCDSCGSADFNSDGDTGTDADIEAFFRVLAGGSC